MKDKIISAFIWSIIWWLIVFWYNYFLNWSNTNNLIQNQPSWDFNTSNMTDIQLENMATRIGISKDELKAKIDAWEDIRSLMPTRSWSWNFNRENFSWTNSN